MRNGDAHLSYEKLVLLKSISPQGEVFFEDTTEVIGNSKSSGPFHMYDLSQVTRRVPRVEQELLTIPEFTQVLEGLVVCVVFCKSPFVLVSFFCFIYIYIKSKGIYQPENIMSSGSSRHDDAAQRK